MISRNSSTLISVPSEFIESSDSSAEVNANSSHISSYRHLTIDIGLGGAVVLGTIGIDKAALFLIGLHKKRVINRRKDDILRNNENAKDQTLRK